MRSNIRTVCTNSHECYLLAIDDEESQLFVLAQTFTPQTNIKLLFARTLAEGLKMIETVPNIELILLDFGLPDSQGIDTLIKVREAARGKIAIIGMSGSHDLEEEAFGHGVIDFFGKPIIEVDLIARCKYAIMNQQRINREIEQKESLKQINESLQEKLTTIENRRGVDSDLIKELADIRREFELDARALYQGAH